MTKRSRSTKPRSNSPASRLFVAVDVVLLSAFDGALFTLVVRRNETPQSGHWALPGGVVAADESLDDAASRVLAVRTGLKDMFLEQLYTFGAPRRDPRERSISVAYYALVDRKRFDAAVREDKALRVARIEVPWEGETGGPVDLFDGEARLVLGFDHSEIVGMAVKRVRGKLDYTPIGFQMLPRKFSLYELQRVHETVLGRPLNKDSFRRRMLASGLLEATGDIQEAVGHRPAELYRFGKRSAV